MVPEGHSSTADEAGGWEAAGKGFWGEEWGAMMRRKEVEHLKRVSDYLSLEYFWLACYPTWGADVPRISRKLQYNNTTLPTG